jgi:hypothetical protein
LLIQSERRAGLSATRSFDIDQHSSAKSFEAVLSLTGDFQTQNQENPTATALLKVGQKMGHFSGQFGAPLQIIPLFLLIYKEVAGVVGFLVLIRKVIK